MGARRKILVVSSMEPSATALYLIETLRDIGHEVRVVSDRAHPVVDDLANAVFDAPRWIEREGFRPDMLLFTEGWTRLLFPSGMQDLDCVSAWYAIGTHLHLRQHLFLAKLFDVTFVAQRRGRILSLPRII
jgi:hypothetical protein